MATGYRQRRRAARRSAQVWGWVGLVALGLPTCLGLGAVLGCAAASAAVAWGF